MLILSFLQLFILLVATYRPLTSSGSGLNFQETPLASLRLLLLPVARLTLLECLDPLILRSGENFMTIVMKIVSLCLLGT